MKKSLIVVAVLGAFASAAHAEDQINSVTFYGVVDAAIGKVDRSASVDPNFPFSVVPVGATKATTPVTGMFNGGISDSRVGVKGSQDLGDGMKAFFTLEEGFNLPTGNTNNGAEGLTNGGTAAANTSLNGQLFNRQAFAGLSGDLGAISYGRQYAPFYDILVQYDPVQYADLFSPLGFSGTFGGGGGVSEDTRVDNSLKYANKIGDFNFGTMYKFGGVAGQSSAKSGFTLNAGYEAGNFGIQAAYQEFNDALKGSTCAGAPCTTNSITGTNVNTLLVTAYDTAAYLISAKYKIDDQATLKVGFESYTFNPAAEPISLASTVYYGQPVSGVSNFTTNQKNNITFIGGDYNFTEHFNLAAGVYNIVADESSDGKTTKSGTSRYLSLLADYHFTKTVDTYFGVMDGRFSGVAYSGTGYYPHNYVTAVGMRYKF